MGIEVSYRRLSPQEFQELRDDTAKADTYFGLAIDEDNDPDGSAYYDRLEADERYLDIDKDWDGLHCLLTGNSAFSKKQSPPPLGNVVVGGEPTEWEATFGMVRYLMPEEVRDVAIALEQITEEELQQRYDPAVFLAEDVYPGGNNWQEANIEELIEVFLKVRDFFSKAAQNGEVVLLSQN